MEKLLEILKGNFPTINFEEEKQLMTNGVLSSMDVVTIIAELEDAFDISVTMEYIQPSYFESVETMMEMIEELQ